MLTLLTKVFGLILLIEDYVPAVVADYVYMALKLELPINSIMKFVKILLQIYSKERPLKVIFLSALRSELIRRWYIRKRDEHSKLYLIINSDVYARFSCENIWKPKRSFNNRHIGQVSRQNGSGHIVPCLCNAKIEF